MSILSILRGRGSMKFNISFKTKKSAQKWANKWNKKIFEGKSVFVVKKSNPKDFHFKPAPFTVGKKKR